MEGRGGIKSVTRKFLREIFFEKRKKAAISATFSQTNNRLKERANISVCKVKKACKGILSLYGAYVNNLCYNVPHNIQGGIYMFYNKYGEKISYDCSDLLKELMQDIEEFGSDLMVEVITEVHDGVKLYLDYFPLEDSSLPTIKDSERVEILKATDLLSLYIEENKIL